MRLLDTLRAGRAERRLIVSRDSLVAVLSTTPAKTKAGTSWMGSPPVRLRRNEVTADASLTYDPPARLKAARTAWELLRAIPVWLPVALSLAVGATLAALIAVGTWALAFVLGGVVLLAAGAVDMLPGYARDLLGLRLPGRLRRFDGMASRAVARPLGRVGTAAVAWALGDPSEPRNAPGSSQVAAG